jgi:hypothetical protein
MELVLSSRSWWDAPLGAIKSALGAFLDRGQAWRPQGRFRLGPGPHECAGVEPPIASRIAAVSRCDLASLPARRLRVLHVIDGARPPGDSGRMMISGRMDDVCAELERMARTEQVPKRGH